MKHFSLLLSLTLAVTAAAQTPATPPHAPVATAWPRMPLPAKSGPAFDLAWMGSIVRVSDPQIDPAGKTLALVVTHNDYDKDENVSEIHRIVLATGADTQLTHRRRAAFPRWSPSGDTLAFLAPDADKHNQVWLLTLTGGDALQLTHSPTSIQQFAWKPDGSAIAYVAEDEAPKKTGADSFDDAFPVGDNDFLVKEHSLPSHLWLIATTSTADARPAEAKRLTSGTWSLPVAFPPGPPASPITFTPDGTKILYEQDENTYSGDRRYGHPEILDLATGNSTPATTHTLYAGYAQVSPDGAHLAYVEPRDGTGRDYRDIFLVDGLTGDGRNLTAPIDRNFFRAIWTPDSKAILVGANDDARASLWLAPLTGPAQKLNLGDITPSIGFWLDANVSALGQIAFSGSRPHHPAEVYLMDSSSAAPRALTHYNDAFDTLGQGKTDVLTWTSPLPAPDPKTGKLPKDAKQLTINGLLTYPPHYTAGKKLPLVLYIHGGPTSSSHDSFSTFAQLLAAQGWLVFEPNYRGSDNEGQSFATAINDDSGDGPGRDALAGVEAVKKLGIVDEANIAVTGWSYGGYMTSWLIGHANFWKAAIAGAPVTNLLDQYNLSDANVARAAAIGGSPYTADWMQHFVEQSPITYYKNMVTPTLVLQDTGDYRVTITQGYELFHALKDRGIRTEFYAYPVGGHFPADPVRVRDVYRRWIEWLNQFLPHD